VCRSRVKCCAELSRLGKDATVATRGFGANAPRVCANLRTAREVLRSCVVTPMPLDPSGVIPCAAAPPRVLVIDDGAEARDLYCVCIEHQGFAAEAAEDGPSGLARAFAMLPDIVVLDFSMPRMDGAEVLQRLKADPRTRDIPIVMLTAVPDLVTAHTRAGCAAFLEKPCDPDRLLQAIMGISGLGSPKAVRRIPPPVRD
jgi:two-component system, cell cycle response regulator DivK